MEFIENNYDWLFSGAGISVIAIISTVFLFIARSLFKKIQKNKGSSKNRSILNCYRYIPNNVLTRIFDSDRVCRSVIIDLHPRRESIRLNLGDDPDCQVWLQITNHLPFIVDFDNIKGTVRYKGCSIEVEARDHYEIDAHETSSLFLLSGSLTDSQAKKCAEESDCTYSSINIRAKISTGFSSHKKQTGDLENANVEIINVLSRMA